MIQPEAQQFLIFSVAEKYFAVQLMDVKRVLPFDKICKVPLARDNFEGILKLEGKVIPLFNIGRALGINCGTSPKEQLVSVENLRGEDIGFLIDNVQRVVTLDSDYFEEIESELPGVKKKALWEGHEVFLLSGDELVFGNAENG